ncbi:hypothetical protein BGZ54_000631 [Gamsiella multidivaricata]|nr:hypothetical protein BGZ54_000631 [Gamsiella multidivaricata]
MSPVATTTLNSRSQTDARVQAKLSIRPEESINRDADADVLYRLNNTIQVTRPVWNQLRGTNVNASTDTQGTNAAL